MEKSVWINVTSYKELKHVMNVEGLATYIIDMGNTKNKQVLF